MDLLWQKKNGLPNLKRDSFKIICEIVAMILAIPTLKAATESVLIYEHSMVRWQKSDEKSYNESNSTSSDKFSYNLQRNAPDILYLIQKIVSNILAYYK